MAQAILSYHFQLVSAQEMKVLQGAWSAGEGGGHGAYRGREKWQIQTNDQGVENSRSINGF